MLQGDRHSAIHCLQRTGFSVDTRRSLICLLVLAAVYTLINQKQLGAGRKNIQSHSCACAHANPLAVNNAWRSHCSAFTTEDGDQLPQAFGQGPVVWEVGNIWKPAKGLCVATKDQNGYVCSLLTGKNCSVFVVHTTYYHSSFVPQIPLTKWGAGEHFVDFSVRKS